MKNFLIISAAIASLAIAGFIGYYLLVTVPNHQKAQLDLQKQQLQQKKQQDDITNKQAAEKAYLDCVKEKMASSYDCYSIKPGN